MLPAPPLQTPSSQTPPPAPGPPSPPRVSGGLRRARPARTGSGYEAGRKRSGSGRTTRRAELPLRSCVLCSKESGCGARAGDKGSGCLFCPANPCAAGTPQTSRAGGHSEVGREGAGGAHREVELEGASRVIESQRGGAGGDARGPTGQPPPPSPPATSAESPGVQTPVALLSPPAHI